MKNIFAGLFLFSNNKQQPIIQQPPQPSIITAGMFNNNVVVVENNKINTAVPQELTTTQTTNPTTIPNNPNVLNENLSHKTTCGFKDAVIMQNVVENVVSVGGVVDDGDELTKETAECVGVVETTTPQEETEPKNETPPSPKHPAVLPEIRHLVFSGGGVIGFAYYAALRECEKAGVWKLSQIQTIHATSAGSVLAAMIALGYEWTILDEYLIKRPWQSIFPLDIHTVLSMYQERGIFTPEQMRQIFSPLLKGKDLTDDITLQEFYDWSGIEIHVFATEINTRNTINVDFSYKTHPDWRLLDVIYCSCCLPVLFRPFLKDGLCFMDGGMFDNNYPLVPCLKQVGVENIQHVLGFTRSRESPVEAVQITTETTLMDTCLTIMKKLVERVGETTQKLVAIPYEITVDLPPTSPPQLFLALQSQQERERLFALGVSSSQLLIYGDDAETI